MKGFSVYLYLYQRGGLQEFFSAEAIVDLGSVCSPEITKQVK